MIFSGINVEDKEKTYQDFTGRVRSSIESFIQKYNPNIYKYIPKDRFTDKLLQEKITEAESQLSRCATSEEQREVPNLLKFVVVFKGDECVYAGEPLNNYTPNPEI